MSLPFDIARLALRPTDANSSSLKIAPLRSSADVKERVSTDTNQKHVKKVTTVTTSRHAGQRIVNKNTLTTTTNTNTHGVVVLGQPEQHRAVTQERSSGEFYRDDGSNNSSSPSQSGITKGQMFGFSKSQRRGPETRIRKGGKYQSDKQFQELEQIHQKRLVGTLASKFENKQDISLNNVTRDKWDVTMTSGGSNKKQFRKPGSCDMNKMIQNLADDMFGATKTNRVNENNPCENTAFNNSQFYTSDYSIKRKDDAPHFTSIPTTHSSQGVEYFAPRERKSSMKTYTYSIPKSSLFQVSSSHLKSILSSPEEIPYLASNPPSYSNTYTSNVMTSNEENNNAALHKDNDNLLTSLDQVKCDNVPMRLVSSFENRNITNLRADPFLENTTTPNLIRGGLDYSRIWWPVTRPLEVKPARKVTCYKDYLTL